MSKTFLFLFVAALAAFAQAPKPSFEVASVRPGSGKPMVINGMSIVGAMQGGPGTADPESIRMNSVSLRQVVVAAYRMKGYQVFGPDWIANTIYDIEAKVAPGATKEQYFLMLQDLLEQRFAIKVHHENRDYKAYNLIEAKGGVKLKDKVSTGACAAGARPVGGTCPANAVMISGLARAAEGGKAGWSTGPVEGGFVAVGHSATMDMIAGALATRTQGLQVVDKTGIAGIFDFRLEFAPTDVGAQGGDFAFSSIFTAVEKEFGLRLEPVTVSQDALVVDKIEKPTEN